MLYVVGHRPTPAILRLADERGIVVTGSVPDVRPYLARAAAVVAPLQIARGIQNKVLEAMAVGRLVVASPGAITGLNVRPGEELMQATSAEEWVEALTEALTDHGLQNQFGRSARSYVRRFHEWSAALAPFKDLLAIGHDPRTDGHQGVAGASSPSVRPMMPVPMPLELEAPATRA
jgi:glycosyltransferase involved in cell wall biosynthesis